MSIFSIVLFAAGVIFLIFLIKGIIGFIESIRPGRSKEMENQLRNIHRRESNTESTENKKSGGLFLNKDAGKPYKKAVDTMEESRKRMAENQRRTMENQRRMAENQQRIQETTRMNNEIRKRSEAARKQHEDIVKANNRRNRGW
jgi:hypothetical protein